MYSHSIVCGSGVIGEIHLQRKDGGWWWWWGIRLKYEWVKRCWKRLPRVLWTTRGSNQSILRETNPEYSLEELMLKLQYFHDLMERTHSLENTLMLGKIEGKRRRGPQRTRRLMASVMRCTLTWESFRRWWGTGRPGVLQSTGLQRDMTGQLNSNKRWWTWMTSLFQPCQPLQPLSSATASLKWRNFFSLTSLLTLKHSYMLHFCLKSVFHWTLSCLCPHIIMLGNLLPLTPQIKFNSERPSLHLRPT